MWFKSKIKPKKIKSINTLQLESEGINVIKSLPHLDLPNFRNSQELARRTLILVAIFQLYLEAPLEEVKEWLNKNDLLKDLTNQEKKYLKVDYDKLSEQDQIDIYWIVEAIWTFAWVGGLHNNLTLNTGVEDVLASLLPNLGGDDSAKEFIENFKVRNEFEIFTILDRFYRAHSYARKLHREEKGKVDLDIIIERRKALEFTCYSDFDWDDTPLDT